MSGNTAIERLLEVSNKLWDAMFKSGEVPTYGERAHYYLALKDAMDENEKLRELVLELWTYAEQELLCDENCPYGAVCDWRDCVFMRRMRELGVEVDDG